MLCLAVWFIVSEGKYFSFFLVRGRCFLLLQKACLSELRSCCAVWGLRRVLLRPLRDSWWQHLSRREETCRRCFLKPERRGIAFRWSAPAAISRGLVAVCVWGGCRAGLCGRPEPVAASSSRFQPARRQTKWRRCLPRASTAGGSTRQLGENRFETGEEVSGQGTGEVMPEERRRPEGREA